MKRALLPAVLAVLCAVSGATADAFRSATAPASVCWLWHVDVSGMKGTETGKRLLADPAVSRSPQLAGFAARFGLDPIKDMRGLTVYTVSTGRLDAVAVIHPEPAAAERLKTASASDPVQSFGGYPIRSKADNRGTVYYTLTGNGLMVAALTPDRVRLGLDVLTGKRTGLTGTTIPALADRQGGAGAVIVLVGTSFGADVTGLMPQLSLLKNANSLCLTLREKAGKVEGALTVAARDEADSERLYNTLLGLVELGKAMGTGESSNALKTVAVTREGQFARAGGSWSSSEILRFLAGS